jgi:transcriptional regulator with XRE-family HTH domain
MTASEWTPERIRRLRGRRTQEELGKIIRVPKNTVWRWEAGYAKPDAERSKRLDRVARRERVVEGWKVEGSVILLGDLEEGSKHLARHFRISPRRLALRMD